MKLRAVVLEIPEDLEDYELMQLMRTALGVYSSKMQNMYVSEGDDIKKKYYFRQANLSIKINPLMRFHDVTPEGNLQK